MQLAGVYARFLKLKDSHNGCNMGPDLRQHRLILPHGSSSISRCAHILAKTIAGMIPVTAIRVHLAGAADLFNVEGISVNRARGILDLWRNEVLADMGRVCAWASVDLALPR